MLLPFPPEEAWQPLPARSWDADHARHLLRRAAWTATPPEVERAVAEGLDRTFDRLFPAAAPAWTKPDFVTAAEDAARELRGKAREQNGIERRRVERDLREKLRGAVQRLGIDWLEFAAQPAHGAFAKWVLCLSDVFVVSAEKVRHPGLLHRHFTILGDHALGPAPQLAKAVSRSPAMVSYLDLNQSRRTAPNENFARELFELFVLGEGNYTEQDIKEAARAFTGYRAQPLEGEFRFVRAQHDPRPKTVFGQTGAFSGDDVIDLAYGQPAAATFLPREMGRFYLCEEPLPAAHLAALGAAWRESGYDLRWLLKRFFTSRAFFTPSFRGELIKAPIQYHLGLLQDLGLDLAPIPRLTLVPLRQMGQLPFHPPNVRGWVGGRQWINSATIAARRQLVAALFSPINERTLNADERAELQAAEAKAPRRFTVAEEAFALPGVTLAEGAAGLTRRFLATDSPQARDALAEFLQPSPRSPGRAEPTLAQAVAILVQSPDYQLC